MADPNKITRNRHHECELFHGNRQHEAAESIQKWRNCKKNPDHTNFISPQDFINIHLPNVQDVRSREKLRSCIDLTVRLRVHYTSKERPDDDQFSKCRGTNRRRMGTGFIQHVYPPNTNKPCSCVACGGNIAKKQWTFLVRTAHHVLYDTKEAEKTKVDLFYDDESCENDGRMKSVWGVKVLRCNPDLDMCDMLCATCDEDLGERIEHAWRCYDESRRSYLDLSGLDLLSSCDKDCRPALIVSYPHGQPKRITVGEERADKENDRCVNYTVPTCPGSSGAPVFRFRSIRDKFDGLDVFFFSPVHSGSCNSFFLDHEDQLNCGFFVYN